MASAVSFRSLTREDFPLLHEWLGRPHVAEWWGGSPSLAEVEMAFGLMLDGTSTTRAYIVLGDGRPIGYTQSYMALGSGDGWWPDEVDPGVRGIDQWGRETLAADDVGVLVRAPARWGAGPSTGVSTGGWIEPDPGARFTDWTFGRR